MALRVGCLRHHTPNETIGLAQALFVVSYGVAVGSTEQNGRKIEIVRLATGDYFGENGLLSGKLLNGQVTALTRMRSPHSSRLGPPWPRN